MTTSETAGLCPVTTRSLEEGAPPRPVIDLDVHGERFSEQNYDIYRELLQTAPVAWDERNGGFWMLTGYRPVFEATKDDDLFLSAPGTGLPKDGQEALAAGTGPIPIEIDPPGTQQYRKPVLGLLSPKAVAAMEPGIRAAADELIDAFIESGEGDLVQQLSTPLPALMALRILGMDESRWPEFVHWIHTIIHGDRTEAGEAQIALFGEVAKALEERTALADQPDDVLTAVVTGQVDGETIGFMEQVRYVFLVMLGGMDTTSGLTGNSLERIARDPALRQQLVERRELLERATEEFLRVGTPTQGLARTLSRDAEFHGQQMRAGERVMLMWAASNYDPDEFADPDTVDVERWPNKHMAFGVGIHRCLGSNLARTMFQVMIDRVLDRLPDFELTVDEVPRFDDAGNVYAPTGFPVRFTPGPRLSPAERASSVLH
jgi:cytochrome P450